MGDVVGQILSFAVGVAVSPVPIIAVVLMLTTDRGRVNGPAFVLGWIAGLALAGTAILLLAGHLGRRAQADARPRPACTCCQAMAWAPGRQ
jgi:threonine/homoserine/homoserine lactone efflux protein